MDVLGLASSPRRNSNTTLLLEELLRGASEGGLATEKIDLTKLDIKPCKHCDYCLKHGHCVIKDDMADVIDRLEKARCIILASPIYFMAHCAQAKVMIDRCQVFWARRYVLKTQPPPTEAPHRKGIFISVGGTRGEKVFAGAKITMKWWFDSLGVNYVDNLLFEHIDKAGEIQSCSDALNLSFQAGKDLSQINWKF